MTVKRWVQVGCILAFLAACMGTLSFLLLFTQAAPPYEYPEWEQAAAVTSLGEETAFDPMEPQPLEEGAFYRFTTTLPPERADGMWLICETAGMEAAFLLNGAEVWRSAAVRDPAAINLSQVRLPLPPGGGERLDMEVRILGEVGLFPPMLRLTGDPNEQAATIAYANYYGFPAGAMALSAVLLLGLFLLGVSRGRPDWRLLLPTLASALLVACRLTTGCGVWFLPSAVWEALCTPWLEWAAAMALLLFLVLRRDRAFWRSFGWTSGWSAAALAAAWGLSALRGGYLARYMADLAVEVKAGVLQGVFYWLIWWLVLVCAGLSAWELARYIVRTQTQAQALALKNQLAMENYRTMEAQLRETAALRHEFRHQLAAMDTLVKAGDLAELERCVSAWSTQTDSTEQFSRHIAVNTILQRAAGRAREMGIEFHASAVLPPDLPIPTEDLCSLLMNLLDNALEGAAHTPEGKPRWVVFRARVSGSFLPIFCENTYDGAVCTDGQGRLLTRKPDRSVHGFGMEQMRTVVERYGSILDVQWTQERFTVQTALQLPDQT